MLCIKIAVQNDRKWDDELLNRFREMYVSICKRIERNVNEFVSNEMRLLFSWELDCAKAKRIIV